MSEAFCWGLLKAFTIGAALFSAPGGWRSNNSFPAQPIVTNDLQVA
jgi:hypothetical protein